MPAEQRNLQWYRYVDDNGANRAIMTEKDWGDSTASGCTTIAGGETVFGAQSKTHHTRKVVYRDPTTFRIIKYVVCTAAAYAALPTTQQVWVPGLATQVTYNLQQRIPEKQRIPTSTSFNKIDHP
jgi:hypothetical protein